MGLVVNLVNIIVFYWNGCYKCWDNEGIKMIGIMRMLWLLGSCMCGNKLRRCVKEVDGILFI